MSDLPRKWRCPYCQKVWNRYTWYVGHSSRCKKKDRYEREVLAPLMQGLAVSTIPCGKGGVREYRVIENSKQMPTDIPEGYLSTVDRMKLRG